MFGIFYSDVEEPNDTVLEELIANQRIRMLPARSGIAISWRSDSESEDLREFAEEQDSTRLEEPCFNIQYYVLEEPNPPI